MSRANRTTTHGPAPVVRASTPNAPPPRISVVLWTDRERPFNLVVAAIASAVRQPEATEVIVVVDHDPPLLERLQRAWGGLMVVANRYDRGPAGARNTGMETARGDIVAFLDDGAIAADDWLREMIAAYEGPEVLAVVGKAVPVWPTRSLGVRLPPELLWLVGCAYDGLPAERADISKAVGSALSVRREPLLALGGFLHDGRTSTTHPSGVPETDLCVRLREAHPAGRIVYEPRSRLHHRVGATEVSWAHVRLRSFREGISSSRASVVWRTAASSSPPLPWTLATALVREMRAGHGSAAVTVVVTAIFSGAGFLWGRVAQSYARGSAVRAVLSTS